ncbi:fatty-acyl-CoA synthase [Haloechinothrix alba]|uniref:Fatty-acyl-CoA synthase n=1 Tax=Haloechinothrix alba TaxID=664784 RepID=A0A238ZKX3_9PSEU|nr:AMP-binding protein [Haloechinothrix alba]SNR83960.1 fatty-acyl-CoA synthase [Haloechinothrix alba]
MQSMLDHTLGSLVERCGHAYGEKVAVTSGDRRITYVEQIERIRKAGRALLALDLRHGDRVAILMEDCPELLDVFYGAAWAGLVVVPLNAKLGAVDHAHIIADSGARAIAHDAAHAERVEKIHKELDIEIVLGVDDGSVIPGGHSMPRLLDQQHASPGRPAVVPDDLFGIYYTGGTTGQPKGVVHSHRTFVAALFSELLELGLGEREVFAHVAPLTHAGGGFVLPVWLRGGTNVILGGFDPQRLLHAVATEHVTSTMLVPTMLYMLLDTETGHGFDLSSLSTVVYGASPIGHQRLLEAIERFGPIFAQLYGQTEAPNQLTVLSKQDHADAVISGDLTSLSSCGRPVTIADVRLFDENFGDVEAGGVGEIAARGPHTMLRYWNRQDETEATLRNGWLCTGDLARSDERGFLYIVDRKKDLIISGGFNVYPKEVETALFEHPAVRDACVIGVPDEKWGETVKAVVVTDQNAGVRTDELITWVKERKGSVQAPKSVEFLDQIPVTAVGKHDKPALRNAYWAGRIRSVN